MTSIRFFNRHSMPLMGLGTWQSNNEELEQALDAALETGYRHIDTAYFYQNENVIGKVLKRWIDSGKIIREELFVVTKLPPMGMRPEHVSHFLQLSLKNLQLDYIDLYLIHLPIGYNFLTIAEIMDPKTDPNSIVDMSTDLESVWRAMEEQVLNGLVRSIGISNFSRAQIDRIMKICQIQPANHQLELHVYFQRPALVETCRKYNISIVAYGAIGSPGRKDDFYQKLKTNFTPILENPLVLKLARNHSKTPAQIALKFLVQQDIAVIPKSINVERLELHVYFQRPALVETCRKYNISIVAYGAIGSPGRKDDFYQKLKTNFTPILENPLVLKLARNHSKTPAQIALKFLVQQDIAVIPKSINVERLFSFELTPEEMLQLKALDQGEAGRIFFAEPFLPPNVKDHPEETFVD